MTDLFLYFLPLSIKAMVIIPLIIWVRFLIRKQPKIYSYALWAVVFLGLLVNVKIALPDTHRFFTPVGTVNNSLINQYDNIMDDYVGEADFYHTNTLEYYEAVESGIVPVYDGEVGSYVVTAKDSITPPSTVKNSVMPMLAVVWASGVMTALFIFLKNIIDFYVKLSGAEKYKDNIYISYNITSPLVYGFLKPKIYIPSSMADLPLERIIKHEQTHIRRGDHIIKPLCMTIAVIHWFNPLVWLAFRLMCRDMEMSCDESVIRQDGNKKEYSLRLLNCATDKKLQPSPMVLFGEADAESRIKNILSYKQPAKMVSVLLMTVVAICFTACVVEQKAEEIIPTPAPKTFYEQLAEVNSTDDVQYKERYLCESAPAVINSDIPQKIHDLVITVKKPDVEFNSLAYNSFTGTFTLTDGGLVSTYAYKFKDDNNLYIGRSDSEKAVVEKVPVNDGETLLSVVTGREVLADNLEFRTYYTEEKGEDGSRWLNIQRIKNGKTDLFRHKIDSGNTSLLRSLRFLNENVGIMGQLNKDFYNSIPQANITVDGGKTWHQLDFSQLVAPEYFKSYRSCCMTMVDKRIDLRYFVRPSDEMIAKHNTDAYPFSTTAESYSIVSEDGGLTWTGYLRTRDSETGKYVYVKVTETIPVQILD